MLPPAGAASRERFDVGLRGFATRRPFLSFRTGWGPYAQPVVESYFDLSYTPLLLPLFTLLRMGPRQSGAWISAESVRVVMGWAFRATIPRSALRKIVPDTDTVTAWGVHGWRRRWLVNGSSAGIVRLEIEPAARACVIGIPILLETLWLSVASPSELINELGGG
jgi:hypothetical protein